MNDLMMHNLTEFNRRDTPDEANSWIREIERVIACLEEQKLTYATFILMGETEYWWRGM